MLLLGVLCFRGQSVHFVGSKLKNVTILSIMPSAFRTRRSSWFRGSTSKTTRQVNILFFLKYFEA